MGLVTQLQQEEETPAFVTPVSEAAALNIARVKPEKSFYELYHSMFEGVIADTEELIDECYKLRYKVYCVEHPYEEHDPANGEYERDQYDGHSLHALLRHKQTGEFIGTVRLIVDEKDSPQRMPAIQICEDNNIPIPSHIYNQACTEISRFCISKEFRRRITDTMYSSAYTPQELIAVKNRVIPFMAIGLMSMVYKMSHQHGITQSCAVMEPSLLRMLGKLGLHFKPVGEPVEYHGLRQFAYIKSSEMIEQLLEERPDVLEVITERGLFV